jgi:hypothetical protein
LHAIQDGERPMCNFPSLYVCVTGYSYWWRTVPDCCWCMSVYLYRKRVSVVCWAAYPHKHCSVLLNQCKRCSSSSREHHALPGIIAPPCKPCIKVHTPWLLVCGWQSLFCVTGAGAGIATHHSHLAGNAQ